MSSFSCVPALPAAEKALTASGMTLLFVAWVAPIWALPLDPFSTFFAKAFDHRLWGMENPP